MDIKNYEFWFVTGGQSLYGEKQLKLVAADAEDIVNKLNESGKLPYKVVFKGVMATAEGITKFMKEANYSDNVAGVMIRMHTFSPAKNWIRETKFLRKSLPYLAAQYSNKIPYDTIDFDYMSSNQSTHGDREYAYTNARLRKHNKIVYGFWGDEEVQEEIADWQNVAVAYSGSFNIKIVRFGDTMWNVAITEGNKIEAQMFLGWAVDYWPVSGLVEYVNGINEEEAGAAYKDLVGHYEMVQGDNTEEHYEYSVRCQLRGYLGLKRFMDEKGYTGFTTSFEDLHGLKELFGLAAQLLMRNGYGFGAEGDWKSAGMDRLLKTAADNVTTAFMEDYISDLRPGHQAILGSHMFEINLTIASDKPRAEVHPLDIGSKDDPARLVFTSREGKTVDVTLSYFNDGYRVIGYSIDCHKPEAGTPHLPVAKQLWTPTVSLREGVERWMHTGGGHRTILSSSLKPQQTKDLFGMLDVKVDFIE